jgi:hypothetical protein
MTLQRSEGKKLEWKTTLHVQVITAWHWWSSSIQGVTYDPCDLYGLTSYKTEISLTSGKDQTISNKWQDLTISLQVVTLNHLSTSGTIERNITLQVWLCEYDTNAKPPLNLLNRGAYVQPFGAAKHSVTETKECRSLEWGEIQGNLCTWIPNHASFIPFGGQYYNLPESLLSMITLSPPQHHSNTPALHWFDSPFNHPNSNLVGAQAADVIKIWTFILPTK